MNDFKIAHEIIRIAKELIGLEFPNQEAYNSYLKEHPLADKSNHTVKHVEEHKEQKIDRHDVLQELTDKGLSGVGKLKYWTTVEIVASCLDLDDVAKKFTDARELESCIFALKSYLGYSFASINNSLRSKKKDDGYKKANMIDKILSVAPKSTHDVVFRGMNFVDKKDIDKMNFKEGRVFKERGFLSASTNKKVATDFEYKKNHRVLMEIRGVSGQGVKIQNIGIDDTENEILFRSGMMLKIVSVKKNESEGSIQYDVVAESLRKKKNAGDVYRVDASDHVQTMSKTQRSRLFEPLSFEEVKSDNKTAHDLIRIASKLVPRIIAEYTRKEDTEEKELNSIEFDIQRFVSTLRDNESLKCFVNREDDGKMMKITIGFSDHEEMNGIVKSIVELMEKKGRKSGLKIKVKVVGS